MVSADKITVEVLRNTDIVSGIFEFLTKETIDAMLELSSSEGDVFLNESCVEAYRNWKYQRNADTIFTAVLMRALERQNLAVTVFIDESTVFDNIAEYLTGTGDGILNLNRANILNSDVKKNGLCQELKKQFGPSMYHHRKDLEYRNGEQEEEFLTLVSQVRRSKVIIG